MSALFCTTCGLPKTDHTPEMTANCAVFDLSQSLSAAAPRSEAESAPGRESSPQEPPFRSGAFISVASVLLGWCNDIKRELEEFANDGPVGPMVPYRLDPNTRQEDLVGLLVSLRGVSGTNDKGLIGILGDVANDVAAALASTMDRRVETCAGMDIERHAGTQRKSWEVDLLAKEVASRTMATLGEALVDGESGEVKAGSEAAAVGGSAVANAFYKTFRFTPRVKPLYDLGIQPSLYCSEEPGRPGVVVRQHRDVVE